MCVFLFASNTGTARGAAITALGSRVIQLEAGNCECLMLSEMPRSTNLRWWPCHWRCLAEAHYAWHHRSQPGTPCACIRRTFLIQRWWRCRTGSGSSEPPPSLAHTHPPLDEVRIQRAPVSPQGHHPAFCVYKKEAEHTVVGRQRTGSLCRKMPRRMLPEQHPTHNSLFSPSSFASCRL